MPLVLLALLPLGACGLAPAVIMSAVGLGFTVAKDIVGIDIALTQDTPGKVPIATVITSELKPEQPGVQPPVATRGGAP